MKFADEHTANVFKESGKAATVESILTAMHAVVGTLPSHSQLDRWIKKRERGVGENARGRKVNVVFELAVLSAMHQPPASQASRKSTAGQPADVTDVATCS